MLGPTANRLAECYKDDPARGRGSSRRGITVVFCPGLLIGGRRCAVPGGSVSADHVLEGGG